MSGRVNPGAVHDRVMRVMFKEDEHGSSKMPRIVWMQVSQGSFRFSVRQSNLDAA